MCPLCLYYMLTSGNRNLKIIVMTQHDRLRTKIQVIDGNRKKKLSLNNNTVSHFQICTSELKPLQLPLR